MEILQTIWTSLTSENIILVNVINSILTFIEASVSMLLFTYVLNINSNSKQKFIHVILFSVIAIITKLIIPIPYNTFVNIIVLPVLVYFIFKTTFLKAILSEVIVFISFVILGSIMQIIYPLIFKMPIELLNNIPTYSLIINLSTYIIVYTIYFLFKKFNIKLNKIDNIRFNNPTLIINFVIGIIAIFIQAYMAATFSSVIPISMLSLNIFVLFIYFCTSIYSLSRTTKLEVTTKNLEEVKLYNKTLIILHDNIRGFKHDFNNIVQAIGGYVATNDMEGLKKYYSDLLLDCQKVTNLSTLNPQVINSPPIFGILTDKYHKADEKGIKINLEIFLDLNTLNMKMYEFTRILGILLDNAIEAAKECNEKIINIQMRKDSRTNRQLIIIENTYTNKDINIDKIFEKSYTTKPNNSGLGLWEVRQILKKNNNLNLFTTKDNKFFKQQLEIYM